MAGLFNTTTDLGRLRRQWRGIAAATAATRAFGSGSAQAGGRNLTEVTGFGSNPGGLRMFTFVPDDLPAQAPLVVVCHGCTQDAAGYDFGAGWSTLAERYGFMLVLPQQTPANNPKTCFNWFLPGDTARDSGEVLSIRQMVEHAVAEGGVDERRIFVTGLSAGGAMTSALLATYPELFAGGGIVAGLPFGTARNVQEALRAMFEQTERPAREWGDLVRSASAHRGPWPRVSVWHGSADATVTALNGREIVKQWADLHGVPTSPSGRDIVNGHPREVWRDREGREVIESFTIAGMAHGAPLQVGAGDDMAGTAGPFLLDVGISSSYHIARFWGLVSGPARDVRPSGGTAVVPHATAASNPRQPEQAPDFGSSWPRPGGVDVGGIIRDALRTAGLIKP